MPMMKSPYDQRLSSTSGHCLVFEANVPLWVPPACMQQALGQGVREVDQDAPSPEPVVAPPVKRDNEESDGDEFAVALDQAILRILTRNDPNDYKADNTPKVTKVVAEMSPELRRASATEVSDAFRRLQENINLAE